jgi:hypothetical protein
LFVQDHAGKRLVQDIVPSLGSAAALSDELMATVFLELVDTWLM